MVSKLCIPKTESPDVPSPGSTSHGTNPQTSHLRPMMMGKRRLCTKADDPYGSQKQRLRLASADASMERPSDVVEELQWKATEFTLHPTERNELISSETVTNEAVERDSRMERSEEKNSLSKLFPESHAGFSRPGRVGIESMEVQSETRHQSADAIPEAGHQCDGALCRGTVREPDIPDFKMDGDEIDAGYRSAVSPLPVGGEWRDLRGEMVVDADPRGFIGGGDRVDDGKCPRVFRRYRKVVGKSGSRSDLLNRLTTASEQASRNSTDLDAFFSEMGMDRSAIIASALTETQLDHTVSTTSLNVFENISSIGTPLDSRSCTSRDSQPMEETMSKSLDLDEQPGLGISVVERNARVIRWLCNIRRVSTVTDDGEV